MQDQTAVIPDGDLVFGFGETKEAGWRLRPDERRIVLYKYDFDSLTATEVYRIHPVDAILLALLHGHKLGEVVPRTAGLFQRTEDEMSAWYASSIRKWMDRGAVEVKKDGVEIAPIDPARFAMPAAEVDLQRWWLYRPLDLTLKITDSCQRQCRYCSVERRLDHPSPSTEKWLRVIHDALDHDVVSVSLVGGDPILHHGVYEMIRTITNRGVQPFISTKVFVSRAMAEALYEAGLRSRVIAAETAGRVDSILVHAGQRTDGASTILLLSNAEGEEQAADAKAALDFANADFTAARAQVEQNLMNLRAETARLDGEAAEAAARAESLAQLAAAGLASSAELNLARVRAGSLAERAALARNGLKVAESAVDAQLAARRASIAQAGARYDLRRRAVESLRVKALIGGIVQEVLVEPGQAVTAGQMLARVADSSSLLARIRVPPAQARDVVAGLDVRVDTNGGRVRGRVVRVDPAVRDGSVTVDVTLLDPLPSGVRPDSPIEAAIVLGRIQNALLVRRPANAVEGGVTEIFRIDESGTARRTRVTFGRGSAAVVEVLQGLQAGDEVIVSDTSPWQESSRIRIR